MTLPAPYAPLVASGDGLERYPDADALAPLAARLAALYGVEADQVLVTRGVCHGLELVWRRARRDGAGVQWPNEAPYDALARVYDAASTSPGAIIVRHDGGEATRIAHMAAAAAPALVVVDEGRIEFQDGASALSLIADHDNLVVLRSLSLAYGLAGARVGAATGQAPALARLAQVMEPHALPLPSVRLALQALDPSRLMETDQRVATVRNERARVADALKSLAGAQAAPGPAVVLRAPPDGAAEALRRLSVRFRATGDGLVVAVRLDPAANDRLLAALGVTVQARLRRTGEAVRDTRETRIVCAVDLDTATPVRIETGVGFFDHMLEQVAAHGGFSLRLSCQGDLHTDPHHTIEDSAIALGQALRRALGDRKGIGRYGFVLPMDEAEAKVSIDLSGRPYAVFDGAFATPFIGDYRTDLTAHVVRSLAENLGAAVHVAVTGDDDHHKTEVVFKGLGRALRQAIRIEGGDIPSTKGVL